MRRHGFPRVAPQNVRKKAGFPRMNLPTAAQVKLSGGVEQELHSTSQWPFVTSSRLGALEPYTSSRYGTPLMKNLIPFALATTSILLSVSSSSQPTMIPRQPVAMIVDMQGSTISPGISLSSELRAAQAAREAFDDSISGIDVMLMFVAAIALPSLQLRRRQKKLLRAMRLTN
jgi:hypothetical protein